MIILALLVGALLVAGLAMVDRRIRSDITAVQLALTAERADLSQRLVTLESAFDAALQRQLAPQTTALLAAIPPAVPYDPRPDAIQRAVLALRQRVDQGLLTAPPRAFESAEIDTLLAEVCASVGLDAAKLDAGFDVAATGKLHEVLDGMARRVGQKHPIATAGEIAALFHRVAGELVGSA